MSALRRALAFGALAMSLAGCGSGSVGRLPDIATVDPAKIGTLQFVVGTARINFGPHGSFYVPGDYTGLNVVETFRGPNGLSPVLDDTPTIVGPPGFVGDPDAGGAPTSTIFCARYGVDSTTDVAARLGAFGYGFGQAGATGSYATPLLPAGALGAIVPARAPVAGPPAWPTLPGVPNFVGYPFGFLAYVSGKPVPLGSYRLDVAYPDVGAPGRVSATARLTEGRPLPLFETPRIALIGGPTLFGLTIDLVVPPGLRAGYVEIENKSTVTADGSPYAGKSSVPFLTVAIPVGVPGPVRVTLAPTPDLVPGTYNVYAMGFDYDVYAPSYPSNSAQAPPLGAPGGRADVTISDFVEYLIPQGISQ